MSGHATPATRGAADAGARPSRAGMAWRAALILAATVAALYWRRPDQFRTPYIWVEDGTISLLQYIAHGVSYLAEPVAGYLILPSKLIQLAALAISVDHYPGIAFALTILFTAAVLCAVALSPTTLRRPLACALFLLVLPTDSEVYGTSHYAFWWGSLLLLPPLFWPRSHDARLWPRVAMVGLGGLSSPMVVALLPIFALQAIRVRSLPTILVAATAAACGAVQLWFLRTSGTHGTDVPTSIDPVVVTEKFFGMFVFWSPASEAALPWLSLVLGTVLLALLALAAITARRTLAWRHVALALGLGASIAISVTRVPPEVFHPVLAGPRYFFYPYIFLGWLAIELMPVVRRWIALPLGACLLASLHQVVAYGPRGHHAVDWRGEMARCTAATGDYPLPVHLTGNRADMWTAMVPAGGCKVLRDRSLLP